MSKEELVGEEIVESKVMWYPDSKKNTRLDRFRNLISEKFGTQLANYNELYQWSVENYPEFWAEFWKFSGIIYSHHYSE
ncbi:hypothetical protein scyTo_0022657, partial [Scyliorhinus torazame]|nr:hypothetical protein [Scyliorhinus torazame]